MNSGGLIITYSMWSMMFYIELDAHKLITSFLLSIQQIKFISTLRGALVTF